MSRHVLPAGEYWLGDLRAALPEHLYDCVNRYAPTCTELVPGHWCVVCPLPRPSNAAGLRLYSPELHAHYDIGGVLGLIDHRLIACEKARDVAGRGTFHTASNQLVVDHSPRECCVHVYDPCAGVSLVSVQESSRRRE